MTTIDLDRLFKGLGDTVYDDPILYRLVMMLRYGDAVDVTDLLRDVLVLQSKSNRDLLARVIELSMYAPTSRLQKPVEVKL